MVAKLSMLHVSRGPDYVGHANAIKTINENKDISAYLFIIISITFAFTTSRKYAADVTSICKMDGQINKIIYKHIRILPILDEYLRGKCT